MTNKEEKSKSERRKLIIEQREKFWEGKKGTNIQKKLQDGKMLSSWDILDWVASASALTGSARLIAMQISIHYDQRRRVAYVGYDKLNTYTGLSRATIARALTKITTPPDDKLLIEWKRVRGGYKLHQRLSNSYFPKLDNTYPPGFSGADFKEPDWFSAMEDKK